MPKKTKILQTGELSSDGDCAGAGLKEAARIILRGGLVAFPTETVYGLGADATNGSAVAAVYAAKGRPGFNPLIAHVADLEAAQSLCFFDPAARALAAAYWPGPLTLVLPLRDDGPGVSKLVTAGLPTLAVRVPAHPLARALLREVGRPVAAPSANPSGRISPTTAAHVLAGLDGRIDAVLDGGPTQVGVESTILACGDGTVQVLRDGGVLVEEVETALGRPLTLPQQTEDGQAAKPLSSPGQMASHYAPRGTVRLNATTAQEDEVLLGFGAVAGDLTLSARGDLTEAAANLFACLHRLDEMGATKIAVAPVPETGLGRAINDRLRRAAAPREVC